VRPRFRPGEAVRVVRQPEGARAPLGEGVVEDVDGPAEGRAGWAVSVRVGTALWVLPEDDLEAVAPSAVTAPERIDTLRLRLVTELTDGVEAARVAEQLETALRSVVGPATLELEAERHWADPYHYEFEVAIVPLGDAVSTLHALVAAGGDGWLSCRDDGWRCHLWWSAEHEDGFLVPEVHGAELVLLPWGSPVRRPDEERPLVSV